VKNGETYMPPSNIRNKKVKNHKKEREKKIKISEARENVNRARSVVNVVRWKCI